MSTFGPRCPNHGVPLTRTSDPGIGICPISTARFTFDEDQAEKTKKLKIDSMGGAHYEGDWGLKHIDGDDS